MKTRNGFVSNSSSSSFIITNTSDRKLTLVDFVKENPQLVKQYCERYGESITQEELIRSARREDPMNFKPGKPTESVFGDEQCTLIGRVFDYILRNGGKSENFTWQFDEFLR